MNFPHIIGLSRRFPKIHFFTFSIFIVLGIFGIFTVWTNVGAEQTASSPKRRVNTPYRSPEFPWVESAIFWFGENEHYTHIPSRNYTDVRIAYTDAGLHVRFVIVDYYLWINTDPSPQDDLKLYEAAALYLDTNFDGGTAPQTDDFMFLVGARQNPEENTPAYHRQAKGTGTIWDINWTGVWTDKVGLQWSTCGPNNNGCGLDYGWSAAFVIPWETLDMSGPPVHGDVWGFGVQVYDRDDAPPNGYLPPEYWPETFVSTIPATWAELHFGESVFTPQPAYPQGTTVISASSPDDNTVEDAWMGGGGVCGSGHEGDGVNYGSDVNHGDSSELFVGAETAPTHFPCFNKSFLRFALDDIPDGMVIISATLEIHHWGNADPSGAKPSLAHLFMIKDPWEEMTITWNNAPLAQENISSTWIDPVLTFPGWPGIPYKWDATQAVTAAYAAGQPVSLAIYESDMDQHSTKYLTSSETGDWNADGRPKLTVIWGIGNFQTYYPYIIR